LARIPEGDRAAIVETLRGPLGESPYRVGKPLRLQLEGLFVARRGDYRIVFAVDDASHVVTILRIAHRRDVYRSR
jgi:mRNA-degrading endonuclease RelE of RelBE toxin-antitoxin system